MSTLSPLMRLKKGLAEKDDPDALGCTHTAVAFDDLAAVLAVVEAAKLFLGAINDPVGNREMRKARQAALEVFIAELDQSSGKRLMSLKEGT